MTSTVKDAIILVYYWKILTIYFTTYIDKYFETPFKYTHEYVLCRKQYSVKKKEEKRKRETIWARERNVTFSRRENKQIMTADRAAKSSTRKGEREI